MKQILFILVICIVFVGCKDRLDVKSEYMAFDNLKFEKIGENKLTLKKSEMQIVPIEEPYIKNFVIQDSLLLVDTNLEDGLLDIISLQSMKSYGSYLNKGNAGGEFKYGINLTLQTTFCSENDSLFADFYDFVTGRIFEVNITRTLSEGNVCLRELNFSAEIPRTAFWAKSFRDSLLLVRTLADRDTRQNRSIITNNGIETCLSIEKLNNFEIPVGEDFNILSSLVAVSPTNGTFIEAMIGMNYINVYSLDGDNDFTLCVGDKLDKLSDILSTTKYNRKYMFAEVRAYSFGFAVLEFDTIDKDYQMEINYTPSILFFDWQGNSLGQIKSEFRFNHFDYDESNSMLYVLDSENNLLRCLVQIK